MGYYTLNFQGRRFVLVVVNSNKSAHNKFLRMRMYFNLEIQSLIFDDTLNSKDFFSFDFRMWKENFQEGEKQKNLLVERVKETEEAQITYKIMATSKIPEFITDNPFSVSVKKDQYRFFKVKVLRPETALLIALTIENDDGDLDLFISYGENTRPTISNHQFASISHSKTQIFEINNTDIAPLKSMAGYWGFAIYGRTAASFTLTVAHEDQKMIELKPGTPVEMSLNYYSLVYLKYFHQSESHLQINFTKLSGEMDLYVTDLVKYLPDKDHYKWQISSRSQQRVFTIPMQDYKACVSCLYIMKIQPVYSAGKFSLVLNRLDDILPIQNLLGYSGQLKAQKSAVYKLTSENEEMQLNTAVSEAQSIILGSNSPSIDLENYLWKESFWSKEIFFLNKSTDFLLIHNPSERDMDFYFHLTPKLTPHDRLEQIYSLDPYEKKFFEYTSSTTQIDQTWFDGAGSFYIATDVDIIFYADVALENALEPFLNKGQTLQAQLLLEESTEESKKTIFQAESVPKVRSNESHAIISQKFSGQVREILRRTYLIEIVSPWEFPVKFRLDIGIQAPAYTLIPQKGEKFTGWVGYYEMTMKTSGKWYFWVHSCDAGIDLKIENGDPEYGMVTIPEGGSYFYKEEIQNGTKRFITKNSIITNQKGTFIMYSSLFDEEKFKNFDVKNDSLEVKVSYKYQKNSQNNVTVQFEPAEFIDLESSDEVIYQVQLCSEGSQQFIKAQFCERGGYSCQYSEVRLSAEQKKMITVHLQDVWPGNYSVKIAATIIHQSQPIKIVQPYVLSFVNIIKKPEVKEKKPEPKVIVEEKKSIFWKVSAGIMAFFLIVVVGLIIEKKVMGSQENQEVGSPGTVENTMKGFQPLENEEVEEEEEDIEIEINGV